MKILWISSILFALLANKSTDKFGHHFLANSIQKIDYLLLKDTTDPADSSVADTAYVLNDTLISPSTSSFSVNDSDGWGVYSSFLADVHDSVQMEMILFRRVTDSLDWFEDSYAGKIDSAYIPKEDQFISYEDNNRTWFIRVGADGNCLIRLNAGPAPGNTFGILPVQTRFRKVKDPE